jgi:GNAT superfamily N-acetyltransferase
LRFRSKNPIGRLYGRAVHVRPSTPADDDAVLRLWALARPDLDPASLAPLLAAERRRDPDLVVVAVDGAVIGTATGAFDGVRGWVRKLSVAPEHRRRAVAGALVADLERRFAGLGALQVSLLVQVPNTSARAFWADAGYVEDPTSVYATKRF